MKKIWPVASIVLGTVLIIAVFAIWQGDKSGGIANVSVATPTPSKPPTVVSGISVSPQPFDWGKIKYGGGIVETKFTLKNTTSDILKISKIETSCMCTQASMKLGDKESPFFSMPGHGGPNPGWQADFQPGQEAVITAKFDPAAHGPEGVGKVDRVIRVWFSQPENTYQDVNFVGTVVK